MTDEIHEAAAAIVGDAAAAGLRIVLAESCTGGAVAAALTGVAGASRVVRGSFVTYSLEAKRDWLGVDAELLAEHRTVAAETSRAMADAALRHTPDADIALAVTGHLGPDAEAGLDGHVFIAVTSRSGSEAATKVVLPKSDRRVRQALAVAACLERLATSVSSNCEVKKTEGRDAGSGRE